MALDWNLRVLHGHVRDAFDGSRWMLTGSTAMHAYGMIARQPSDLNYMIDGFEGEAALVLGRVAARAAHQGFRLAYVPAPGDLGEAGVLVGEDPDGRLVRVMVLGGRILPGMSVETPAGPMTPPLVLALTKTDHFIAEPTATNARDFADLARYSGGFDKHLTVYREFLDAIGGEQRLEQLYQAVRTVPLIDETRFHLPSDQVRGLKQDYLRWGQELATEIGVSPGDVRRHLDEVTVFLSLTDDDRLPPDRSPERPRNLGQDLEP